MCLLHVSLHSVKPPAVVGVPDPFLLFKFSLCLSLVVLHVSHHMLKSVFYAHSDLILNYT